jgi:hypothetical protein
MTTRDEAGRSFWGPHGIITKSLACMRAGGRRGAPRARRKAGRGESSTAESHCQPGRRRGIRRALFVCHSHLARAASGLCDAREQQDTCLPPSMRPVADRAASRVRGLRTLRPRPEKFAARARPWPRACLLLVRSSSGRRAAALGGRPFSGLSRPSAKMAARRLARWPHGCAARWQHG